MITKKLRDILSEMVVPITEELRQELDNVDAQFQMQCSIRQRLESGQTMVILNKMTEH